MPRKQVMPAQTDRIQGSTNDALEYLRRELQRFAFLTGKRLTAAVPGAGSVTVQHGLKRVPSYWFLLDIDAGTSVYRSAWTAETITFAEDAGVAANIAVWVG